ncbi:hypothetical protein TorRG33x02_289010 [Trema orientale]|uniref:Uncharacterized protein n=1 Tax=Trema orientale TaxID=63057 RepID=A0A2P5CDL0_TREOI|nr:hypothetical protein TorRG33x02_289010 [Trema orientale]
MKFCSKAREKERSEVPVEEIEWSSALGRKDEETGCGEAAFENTGSEEGFFIFVWGFRGKKRRRV